MQDATSAHGGLTIIPSSMLMSQPEPNDAVGYGSLYPHILGPTSDPSIPLAPYEVDSDSETSSSSAAAVQNLHLVHSLLTQDRQEMVNRHNLCLTRLREASEEADSLRRENTHLRTVNSELNKHLNLLIQAAVQKQLDASTSEYTGLIRTLNRFRGRARALDNEEVSNESPTSVIENGMVENVEAGRLSLPKSISVRSSGYLKMGTHEVASNGGRARSSTRSRAATPQTVKQKICVSGRKKEEEPLELDVYKQGMFKTELCNKWQEAGACPYGDQCQFAHGIEELRPVLRHPRYKTEVCRMVIAGVPCPYGHRCHFRHALTDQERFMIPLKRRPSAPLDR